jgi:hypothetical protein
MEELEREIELVKRHYDLRRNKNVLISVYTNASGFLWNIMMVDSGTDLGWCGFNGNCEFSGSFKTYPDALEDALNLIDKCDLEQFKKETPSGKFHWGNYSEHLNQKYRTLCYPNQK